MATCDQEIVDYIESIGGKAVMTSDTHERATDRTAEAMLKIENDFNTKINIVMMIQGDEPMVTPNMLSVAMKSIVLKRSWSDLFICFKRNLGVT